MKLKEIDIKGTIDRIRKRSFKENFRRLLGINESPSNIALSFAIGILIGLIIPIGLQTIAVLLLSLFLRINIIIAVVCTLISNPLTIIPIYLSALKIGELATPYSLPWNKIEMFLKDPTFEMMVSLGGNGVILILVGSVIQGLIASALSYVFVYQIIVYYRRKHSINVK